MLKRVVKVFAGVLILLVGFLLYAERGRLLRPSTRKLLKEGGLQKLRDRTFSTAISTRAGRANTSARPSSTHCRG